MAMLAECRWIAGVLEVVVTVVIWYASSLHVDSDSADHVYCAKAIHILVHQLQAIEGRRSIPESQGSWEGINGEVLEAVV